MQEKNIKINNEATEYFVRDNGTIWSNKRQRELKGTIQRNEYHTVYLMHNGKQYNYMVHRLVAEAFCPNPNNYNIVHHKNENKLDNRAENLEWVSCSDNILASIDSRKLSNIKKEFMDPLKDWRPLAVNSLYVINSEGEIANLKTHYLLKGTPRNGYLRISIQGKNYSVHKLVYETFVGDIPEKMEIDHIDGNKQNNNVDNLRLVTRSDNMKSAMTNGHSGQISVLQFDKQGNFIQEFPTIRAAANAVGRTHAAIRTAILRGGTSGGYKWEKKNML